MGCCSSALNSLGNSLSFFRSVISAVDNMVPIPSKLGSPLYIGLDCLTFSIRGVGNVLEVLV